MSAPPALRMASSAELHLPGLRRFTRRMMLVLTIAVVAAWMWDRGLQRDLAGWWLTAVTAIEAAAAATLLVGAALRFVPPTSALVRGTGVLEIMLVAVAVSEWLTAGDHHLPLLAGLTVHLTSSTGARGLRQRVVSRVESAAVRLAPIAFAAVIGAGAVVLMLPVSSRNRTPTPFVDAVFTATSATCVTGLIVRDTPTHFSSFGHWTILVLMQIGGLGIMTLSLSLIVMLSRTGGRGREAIAQVMSVSRRSDVFGMVRFVVLVTVVWECIGWAVLMAFPGPPSPSGAGTVFVALFHSVSAFCNAGFSLWPDSLARAPIPVVLTIAALIVTGGLGFAILKDLNDALAALLPRRQPASPPGGSRRLPVRRRMRGWRSLSLHTRLGLATTGILIVAGAALMFFGEYDNTMRDCTFWEKIVHSVFQSVTTRTAGFNTLPFARFSPALLFGTCMLMIIGASPGGTGGGIKTTTAATLTLSLRSLISARNRLEAFGRSVPDALFHRAVAITIVYLGILFTGVFFLLIAEARPPLDLLFEAASALGTVGLSTGITPDLGNEAKLILVGLMFAGRVGPLTLALSIGEPGTTGRFHYPSGDVLVG